MYGDELEEEDEQNNNDRVEVKNKGSSFTRGSVGFSLSYFLNEKKTAKKDKKSKKDKKQKKGKKDKKDGERVGDSDDAHSPSTNVSETIEEGEHESDGDSCDDGQIGEYYTNPMILSVSDNADDVFESAIRENRPLPPSAPRSRKHLPYLASAEELQGQL